MRTLSLRKLTWLLFAAAALAALLAAGAGPAAAGEHSTVHPAVDFYQAQRPGEPVPVIVRVREGAAGAAGQLAGSVAGAKRFPLIDGFAASLSPDDLDRIARDPEVESVSLDAAMLTTDRGGGGDEDGDSLATAYPSATNAVQAWDEGITGGGVTVAVIDSGITGGNDFRARVSGRINFSTLDPSSADRNGHGTYVAGIIAGNASPYVGMAPEARLLGIKVTDRQGAALASDVIQALQWAVENRDDYGIRVVNISLVSSIADSYRQDPLSAAVEEAWFHGIVVVVAAGNFGGEAFTVDHAPANDPYVITSGSFDDAGTAEFADDAAVDWSSAGQTVDGRAKPEVLAPGTDVTSVLAGPSSYVARSFPDAVVEGGYVRLSGTSASAAIVSGAAALMLSQDPGLTPDEVKFRLMATGRALPGAPATAIDAYAAATSDLEGAANQDAVPNDFIDPETGEIMRDSVLWRNVLWRNVLWRSVLWRSVLWRG